VGHTSQGRLRGKVKRHFPKKIELKGKEEQQRIGTHPTIATFIKGKFIQYVF
jgi:hypothetical protein